MGATSWAKGHETRQVLTQRFPQCFAKKSSRHQKRPLKLTIAEDIAERCPDLRPYAIEFALRDYMAGPKYARCLIEGATRIDLDGNPAGEVTAAEAEYGALRSMAREKFIKLRTQIAELTSQLAIAAAGVTLWCCNVRGAGTYIATPSYESALEMADIINRNDTTLFAVPSPWSGSAEEHARAVTDPNAEYAWAYPIEEAQAA